MREGGAARLDKGICRYLSTIRTLKLFSVLASSLIRVCCSPNRAGGPEHYRYTFIARAIIMQPTAPLLASRRQPSVRR
jgi:hypothetical protein